MPKPFLFSTGIENSYPTIEWKGKTIRRDEMEECGHYKHWREDFGLVKELGIEYLRYGPPLYKAMQGPGKFDWSFADETFNALKELDITPIADLCHFGVPDWLGGFNNPDFPRHFTQYARAFAKRFPWVRFYTPVFSGLLGWWNERNHDDRGYVTALHQLCRANVLAMHAILEERKDAVFIQSESSEYFHPDEPSCIARANFLNERRFLSLDLTYGRSIHAEMFQYLIDNGMTRDDYNWFVQNHVRGKCVMGNDYYITNEHLVKADGGIEPSGEIFGYYVITHQYYERYHLPVMHTETNIKDPDDAPRWLRKEWANVHRLKQDGVPLIGFTWYSLTDQIDWDTAMREKNDRVNLCGLYDLDRKIRPVGQTYRTLVDRWRDILPTESHGIHAMF
jgi:beta-glucosidase/6-phospho-beta-glucosidase/beta-galactosidase